MHFVVITNTKSTVIVFNSLMLIILHSMQSAILGDKILPTCIA